MKRFIATAVAAAATALTAAITPAVTPAANACAEGSCSTSTIVYTFYTNSGHLDFAYTRPDGGTYARTNRKFTSQTRRNSGIYKYRQAITVTDEYFVPSSRLSTDEPEDFSWVECYIQVNGTTKYHQYSTGPYASVYC